MEYLYAVATEIGDRYELMVALAWSLQGFQACMADLLLEFWGDLQGTRTFPYKLMYLTFQTNALFWGFGAYWAFCVCFGWTPTILYSCVHIICGLGLFVFINYYILLHFNAALRNEIQVVSSKKQLIHKFQAIPPSEFWALMNSVHAPLLPLSIVPLFLNETVNHSIWINSILSIEATIAVVVLYGCFYASIVQFVHWKCGFWVYPFMVDFTPLMHIGFYIFSFGFFGLISLGYRYIIMIYTNDLNFIVQKIFIVSFMLLCYFCVCEWFYATVDEEKEKKRKKT